MLGITLNSRVQLLDERIVQRRLSDIFCPCLERFVSWEYPAPCCGQCQRTYVRVHRVQDRHEKSVHASAAGNRCWKKGYIMPLGLGLVSAERMLGRNNATECYPRTDSLSFIALQVAPIEPAGLGAAHNAAQVPHELFLDPLLQDHKWTVHPLAI